MSLRRLPGARTRSASRRALLASLGVAGALTLLASPCSAFDPGRAGFEVRVAGEVNPYRVLALFVMPGQEVALEVFRPKGYSKYELVTADGARPSASSSWRWKAPSRPGLYPVRVRRLEPTAEMLFNVFVLVPFTNGVDDALGGYRIGTYPKTALRGLEIYSPPKGLAQIGREHLDVRVSPHFTVGQFLCKQQGDFPKALLLREALLLKLEYLLALVNERGYPAESFHVMSGFRTPHYNAAIGNVAYSRHQWGGAADIFIDESPRDGVMDDLDGNGRIDVDDALRLYELFDELAERPEYEPFVGGLGLYGPTPAHGPFVHVDARGFLARWGR